MSSEIQAIGYDVDGTMVDSEPLHNDAWRQTIHEYGRKFSDLPMDFQQTMAGRKPIAIARFMTERLAITASPEEFLARKHILFMKRVEQVLEPLPGVVESIRRFAGHYRLGIGTSLDRPYVDLILARLDVVDLFDAIVTGDQVVYGKPDPETYMTLAARLGVKPQAMLVLEDAFSGIAAAKAAGCYCIAITTSRPAPQDTSQADIVVSSLNDITDETITKLDD